MNAAVQMPCGSYVVRAAQMPCGEYAVPSFDAVQACAIALLGGAVLQTEKVSAGNGSVVDWRTVMCGETLLSGADAFDTASLFAALVGDEAALASVEDYAPSAPAIRAVPEVTAFMPDSNGGRRRQFNVGGFKVVVEPHEDDEAQAEFTGRLAAMATEVGS